MVSSFSSNSMHFQKILSTAPLIHEPTDIRQCTLGEYTEIGAYSSLENVELGDYSYSCQFCIFQNAVIGKFSNIAAAVRIGPTRHPIERPTLHHFTYRRIQYGFDKADDEELFAQRRGLVTRIGHDTWLGHGAVIMPGVSIGNGAVIGAGAVVTHDVPPYTIAVGVPARVIKQRFDDHIAAALEKIAWWNWSNTMIKERLNDFTQGVEAFIEKYL